LRCHVNKPLRLRDDWVTSESELSCAQEPANPQSGWRMIG
jgi:hypothetical protein